MVTSIILIAIYLLFAISYLISNIKLPKKTMQHIMKKLFSLAYTDQLRSKISTNRPQKN